MPYNYITERGVIVPDTSNTKSEVEGEYKSIFGDDLIIDSESPEGLVINEEVEQRDSLAKNNADLANQINPNISEGVFLDAIFALTGGSRDNGLPSTFSTPPDVTGTPGTFIPQGSRASTASGNVFITTGDVVIGFDGTANVNFQSQVDGAIQVGIGELNQILDQVIGWQTVNNTVAATPGRTVQSDQSARITRRQTLALQGRSTPAAVFSNVRAVDNVLSLSFRENVRNITRIIDGLTMPPNSVYTCVDGGLDSAVAQALLDSKTGGAQWHSGESSLPVSSIITDPFSGQMYTISYDRPDLIRIIAQFTISTTPAITDPVSTVKEAALAYANGEIPGEPGLIVGADVSPFELAGAVSVFNPSIVVRQVTVAIFGNTLTTNTIPIELFQKATLASDDISVVIV